MGRFIGDLGRRMRERVAIPYRPDRAALIRGAVAIPLGYGALRILTACGADGQSANEGRVTIEGREAMTWSGIPQEVSQRTVDMPRGPFRNTTGVAPIAAAEPGKLLVEPGSRDRDGRLFQDHLQDFGGAIDLLSSDTQERFEGNPPAFSNLTEGGYSISSAQKMDVEFTDNRGQTVKISLKDIPNHNWLLVLRGKNSDNGDVDLNTRVKYTDYHPSNIEVLRLSGTPAGGFVSEEYLLQNVNTAHHGRSNSGNTGAQLVSVVAFDQNTGAFTVQTHTRDTADNQWYNIHSNLRP